MSLEAWKKSNHAIRVVVFKAEPAWPRKAMRPAASQHKTPTVALEDPLQSPRFSYSDFDDRQGRRLDRQFQQTPGPMTDRQSAELVTESERLALAQQADPALTALHVAYDLIAREPGKSVARGLSEAGSGTRRLFARHFDPQKLASWVVDPSRSPWHRLTAMRVLEAGCPHWQHLKVAGQTLSIKQITWQLINQCLDQQGLDEAVSLMKLVTDESAMSCRRWLTQSKPGLRLHESARITMGPT